MEPTVPKELQLAVRFNHVHFGYPNDVETVHAVTLDLSAHSFTAIIGPSGSGKSTFLNLIAGLIQPTAGKMENKLRTRMVFQTGALLPWRTVCENVALGLADRPAMSEDAKMRRSHAALGELGIEAFARHYPRDLSGGQRQRVGMARALVAEPELLLLDEPFSALDAETSAKLVAEVDELYRRTGMAMVMVSHSISDAVLLADEIVVVKEGRVSGRVTVPFPRPRMREDAAVLSLIRRVDGMLRG